MAEFVFNADQVASAQEAGSNKIETGIKKLFIQEAYLTKTAKGNNTLTIKVAGKAGAEKGFGLNGFCIDEKWASGKANYDFSKWTDLAYHAGMKTGATETITVKHFGKDQEVQRLVELIDVELTFALQTVFDMNQAGDKAYENVAIYQVFSKDGKTKTEIAGNRPAKKIYKLEDRLEDYKTEAYIDFMENGGPSSDEDSQVLF